MDKLEFGSGYIPRDVHLGDSGREKLVRGIHVLSDAVGSTLGPMGRTAVIESPYVVGGMAVTKDGITVASNVDLEDPVENLGVRMVRQASRGTADDAGDGTSTSVVLARALIDSALGHGVSVGVLSEIVRLSKDVVVPALKAMGRDVDDLSSVATISANNDIVLGGIIGECYEKVGVDGLVTVEKGDREETNFDVTDGMFFSVGYSTPLFITEQSKDRCVLEDALVFISDVELQNYYQIEGVLKYAMNSKRALLIIAPCDRNFLATLAVNKQKGVLKVCAVAPPSFGWKQKEVLSDIAFALGGTYFSQDMGDDLSKVTHEDLGVCEKVVVDRTSMGIVRGDVDVSERVKELRDGIDDAPDADWVRKRIAVLNGSIARIYVGGNSDIEMMEKKDRVDDAVCAVRSALEEGIVAGGGVALFDVQKSSLDESDEYSSDTNTALRILRETLISPMMTILDNAGIEFRAVKVEDVEDFSCKDNCGMNVKTGEMGDMFDMGIVDPLKVVRLAVENAVSVATTILGTNTIISVKR